jgi:UDP-3-O-[3-hydroxymyristoyl] glucosamine N-acyltransferase
MAHTAGELAQYLGAKLFGDAQAEIVGVANPESAGARDVIYVDSSRHVDRAVTSAALCVIVPAGTIVPEKALIEAENPKLAFAKAAAWLMPRPLFRPEIHSTAIVAASARLAPNIRVGPYVVIEDEVEVKSGAIVDAFCFLGRGAHVGEDCWLHPRVTLYPGARLNDRVEIHSGAVIGGDGFGYVSDAARHIKFPQIGRVEIGDDVEIGCNSAIDRGSLGQTRIGPGVKIDNLVQVGHNAQIGERSILVAQVGISGSATIGAGVMLGGQAGLGEHCTLEDGAIVGGQAGVLPGKVVHRGQVVWGTPCRPLESFREQFAALSRLSKLVKRVAALEKLACEGQGREDVSR